MLLWRLSAVRRPSFLRTGKRLRRASGRNGLESQSQPIAIDLFSGCGGLGLGLEQAGFRVVLSADSDDRCLETHRHNMPGPAVKYDLSDPARIDALAGLVGDIEVDLIAGGPPCQPFSRAGIPKIRSLVEEGARSENDERRELWQAYVELIDRIRPKAVLMENVPDMALGDDLIILRSIMGRLEKIGYDVEAKLIDAWRHGVPQHRQRLIPAGAQ